MILNKITTGFVIQSFDTDKQKWISQSFIASDEIAFETEDGEGINQSDFESRILIQAYLPLEMKQP